MGPAVQALSEGYTNSTYRVELRSSPSPVVVRFYRSAGSMATEMETLKAIGDAVPVPEILHVGERAPFAVMTCVEGITFRQLRRTGDGAAVAEAAESIGRALAALHRVRIDRTREVESLPSMFARASESPLLRERLDAASIAIVAELVHANETGLRELDEGTSLVHGDFNNRNVLVARRDGRWRVAAIVDWECARSGSPLFDVARFLQYEQRARPSREPHFTRGYVEGGGLLPQDWPRITRIINLVHQCQLLAEPDVPPEIVDEVRELVARGVE